MPVVVLDTSFLLSTGAKGLSAFKGEEVVIPLAVMRELENKRHDTLVGPAARTVLRALDDLRTQGDLRIGVDYSGARVRVEVNHVDTSDLPDSIKASRDTDVRILAVAKSLRAKLVTKDVPLRVLASIAGVEIADAPTSVIFDRDIDEIQTYHVDNDVMEELYDRGRVKSNLDLQVNTPAILKTYDGASSALVISKPGWELKLVSDRAVSKIEGRSAEQRIALEMLMDPNIGVVSLGGAAGTGKTVLALAAAVAQVIDDKRYEKIVVFRSMYAVGQQELGFLPGEVDEKFSPWTAAIYDALESFLPKTTIEKLKKEKKIEVVPLTFIRGRTFTKTFVIVDEAQLLEYSVILTALTRAGRSTKVVLTHDRSQRDNLRVGRHDGIFAVVQKLSGDKLFAHVALRKSERSAVSEMASRLLDDGVL